MNKKEIFGIILLICVIFSLQAVVAADSGSNSTDGEVLSVDNDVSSFALPSSNTDSLGAANEKNFNDLQNIVNGDVTNFAKNNYTKADGENEVRITHSITLDGDGKVIIDAKKQSRIFNITGEDTVVTLKGITFINGNAAGNGGSIISEGKLTLINCKEEIKLTFQMVHPMQQSVTPNSKTIQLKDLQVLYIGLVLMVQSKIPTLPTIRH